MKMKVLSESNQLTEWLINALFDWVTAHGESYTSIRGFLLHSSWEYSQDILWVSFVMEKNCRSIHNVSLTVVELKKEDSSKSLIGDTIKAYLKSTADIIFGSKDPESLLLSVINLAWLKPIFSLQNHIHCLSDWSSQKVSFKARKLCSDSISNFFALLSNFLVLSPDLVCLFLTHCFFDLYKEWINNLFEYLLCVLPMFPASILRVICLSGSHWSLEI